MNKLLLDRPEDFRAFVGQELGVTDWWKVTQADVDTFGAVTHDPYWLHTDPVRARETEFGGTIAHGFFVLSLAPGFVEQIYEVRQRGVSVNYGLDRVRFISPMPVGERLRMRALLTAVDDLPKGLRITTELTFERDGEERPVCVATWLGMYLQS